MLFNDQDRDGYYHGIDLLFDADTYYTVAEVYAVVYLSYEGGPWNEYGATENFTIFGSSSDDDYVLVSELLEGYPAGSYDILIELFDAYDDTFLAWIGPEDTSELAFLPLEDAEPRCCGRAGGDRCQSWRRWIAGVVADPGPGVDGRGAAPSLAVRMTLRPQAERLSK